MTRHTRMRQVRKLHGKAHLGFRNITMERAKSFYTFTGDLDSSFEWGRYNLNGKVKNRIHFDSTVELQLGGKVMTIPSVKYIDVNEWNRSF